MTDKKRTVSFFDQALKTMRAFHAFKAVFDDYPLPRENGRSYTFDDYCQEHERLLIGYEISDELRRSGNSDGAELAYPHPPQDADKADDEDMAGPVIRADDITFNASRLKNSVDFQLRLKTGLVETLIMDYADNGVGLTAVNVDDFDLTQIAIDAFDKDEFMAMKSAMKRDKTKKGRSIANRRKIDATTELLELACDTRRAVKKGEDQILAFSSTVASRKPQFPFMSDN